MALLGNDIELSKEHQPAGKATPQKDKDSALVSFSDPIWVSRPGQTSSTVK